MYTGILIQASYQLPEIAKAYQVSGFSKNINMTRAIYGDFRRPQKTTIMMDYLETII